MSDLEEVPGLDEYLEQQREQVRENERRGDELARRPNAVRVKVTFGDLRVGDYMTAEEGPRARWVEVVALEEFNPREAGKISITFKTPEPMGIGMHDRWVIDRAAHDEVVIDGTAR